MLILMFAVFLGWLPAKGWDKPNSWYLPIAAYAMIPMATYARYTRSAMLDQLNKPYVTVLRAKGLSERKIVFQHVLRNAAIPVVTVLGLQIGHLLGGSIVVEVVFNYPGVGRMLYAAVFARDYPVVQATVLFAVLVFLFVNLLVDILYALLDPRVRL